jgi:hypothetical protein
MTELPKIPVEKSHNIFEKLCRRSSPRLHHASGALSTALLLLVLSHLLWKMRVASPAYIAVSAVAFVFFSQVGMRVALRHSEAVADHPTTPWSGRWAVKPYPFPS